MIEMPTMLTDREVAELLKVSQITIQRMARRRKLKGVKVGDLWRFNELAVRDFMNQGYKPR